MSDLYEQNDAMSKMRIMSEMGDMSFMSDLTNELRQSMSRVWGNPRYKAERKKISRTVEAWKDTVSRYIQEETDPIKLNILYAVFNAVTYHVSILELETAQDYIISLIGILEGITWKIY